MRQIIAAILFILSTLTGIDAISVHSTSIAYYACIDGHIVEKAEDCPPRMHVSKPVRGSGDHGSGGGDGGLLGGLLGGLGGLI